jgi:hypothetical protein
MTSRRFLTAVAAALAVSASGLTLATAGPAAAATYSPPDVATSAANPFDLGSPGEAVTINLANRCSATGGPTVATLSLGPNQGMVNPVVTPATFPIDCSAGQVVPYTVTFTPTTVPGTYVNYVVSTNAEGQSGSPYYFKFTVPTNPPLCAPPVNRNARQTIQAEQWNDHRGITTWGPCTGIGSFDGNDWLEYANVDFGATSPALVSIRLATPNAGRKIYVRVDSPTGPVIATVTTTATGTSWNTVATQDQSTNVSTPVTGVHRVYLTTDPLSTSPYNWGVANVDSFTFL